MMMKILKKDLHTYLKVIGIIFIAVLIFGYVVFQARNIVLGPIIKMHSPENGASLDNSLIEIKGNAKNISYISMNGRQIFTDEQGEFNEKLLLSYGYNIITIKVQDRFNREVEKKLELIYK